MSETTAMVKRDEAITALAKESQYSEAQLQVAMDTVGKGLTVPEFQMLVMVSVRTKLDLFAKQIYGIKRKQKQSDGSYKEVMVIQTGIDGFRSIGARTGNFAGMEGPFWCGKDGQWVDVWLEDEPPLAAKVGIYLKGSDKAIWGVAKWREFAPLDDKGHPSGLWRKMPDHMLAKCGEAQAWRKSFPYEMGGVKAEEEVTSEEAVSMSDRVQIEAAREESFPAATEERFDPRSRKATAPEPDVIEAEAIEYTPEAEPTPEPGQPAEVALPFEMPDRLKAVAREALEGINKVAPMDWTPGKTTQERNRLISVLAAKKVSREDVLALLACLHCVTTGEVGSSEELSMAADPRLFVWVCSDVKRLPLLVELSHWYRLERES